jgi:hypothetical protein
LINKIVQSYPNDITFINKPSRTNSIKELIQLITHN